MSVLSISIYIYRERERFFLLGGILRLFLGVSNSYCFVLFFFCLSALVVGWQQKKQHLPVGPRCRWNLHFHNSGFLPRCFAVGLWASISGREIFGYPVTTKGQITLSYQMQKFRYQQLEIQYTTNSNWVQSSNQTAKQAKNNIHPIHVQFQPRTQTTLVLIGNRRVLEVIRVLGK